MLVNQGLCFAHSHHATDIAEPESHASRPHFHFGGHGHQTHDHHADHSHGHDSDRDPPPDDHNGGCAPFIRPAVDHDADAVYCTGTVTLAQDGRTLAVVSATYFAASAILQVTHQNDDWLLRPGPLRGQPASVFDAACPIYLRTLSLRI